MGYQTIKILYIVAAVLGVCAVGWYAYAFVWQRSALVTKQIKVGNAVLTIELAETLPAQERGLSYRETLPVDSGMLFVYHDKAIRHFWMPAMHFPLDVLWITDGRVVGIQENIPPLTDRQITRFQSNQPADMVLEVNAGWIKKHGITTGVPLQF